MSDKKLQAVKFENLNETETLTENYEWTELIQEEVKLRIFLVHK